jgi:hypothetical protein
MRLLVLGVGFGKSRFFVLFEKSISFRLACAKGEFVTKPPKTHWLSDLLTHWGKFPPID